MVKFLKTILKKAKHCKLSSKSLPTLHLPWGSIHILPELPAATVTVADLFIVTMGLELRILLPPPGPPSLYPSLSPSRGFYLAPSRFKLATASQILLLIDYYGEPSRDDHSVNSQLKV